MFCPDCGKEVAEGTKFCNNCGAKIDRSETKVPPVQKPKQEQAQPPKQEPVQPQVIIQQTPITEANLPAQFRPLSPWAYFGYSILFSIPVIGFIFLLIYTFKKSNINRRNFARAYWCGLILCVILFLILCLVAVLTGGGEAIANWMHSL
mgnify:CR=1 FL=1